MKFSRKALLSVDIGDKTSSELFRKAQGLEFLEHCELHLVYVFQTTSMSFGFGDYPLVYPVKADQLSIEQSANATLQNMADSAFGKDFKGKIITTCLFGEDPKARLCDYIRDKHIDLVITWARSKHGIFDSSFSAYVNKHTTANALIIKHPV